MRKRSGYFLADDHLARLRYFAKLPVLAALLLLVLLPGVSSVANADTTRIPLLNTPVTTDLGQHMADQIDGRIAGYSTTPSDIHSLWVTRGDQNGGWQGNGTTLWTNHGAYPLDFSGTAPWAAFGGYLYGTTLISPRHVVLASHVYIGKPNPLPYAVAFVDRNNQVVTRNVVRILNIAGTDIDIGVLDADVPSTIAFYPMISYADQVRYLYTSNIPVIRLDQYDNVYIQDIQGGCGQQGDCFSPTSISYEYSSGIRAPYSSYGGITGDSGNPNFVVIGDQLVFLGAQWFPFSISNAGNYIPQINAAMDLLGGGHHVTELDLSHFTPFTPSTLSDQTMSVVEQSTAGTVVGAIRVNNFQTQSALNFTVLRGDPDSIFQVDPNSGIITVAQPDGIDFSQVRSFTLTIQLTDSSVVGHISTANVTITIAYNPNIAHPVAAAQGSYAWTDQKASGTHAWAGIASSADGKKLAAFEFTGFVWTSSDFGATWTPQSAAGSHNWTSVAISADGTHLLALASDHYAGPVWTATSSDSGVTWNWIERTSSTGAHQWTNAAMSTDGGNQSIVSFDGVLLTSSDGGASWENQVINGGPYNWSAIAISADGTRVAAGAYPGSPNTTPTIFTSSDSGKTWAASSTFNFGVYGLASSADGSKLIAAADTNYLYTSNDFGTTWTEQAGSYLGAVQVASSADAHRLLALAGLYLWVSNDYGVSWARDAQLPVFGANGVAISSDGSRVAVAQNPDIFTGIGLTPTVTTADAAILSSSSARLNGSIDETGFSNATTRGFQYGLTPQFELSTSNAGSFGAASFSTDLSGLSCGVNYYVRAFAVNSLGTTFGRARVFVLPCPAILTYGADLHGAISGAASQVVEIGQSGTPVSAVADAGYVFVQWSDGSTANPRTDLNVRTSLSVTATFTAIDNSGTSSTSSSSPGDADAPMPAWGYLVFAFALLRLARGPQTRAPVKNM